MRPLRRLALPLLAVCLGIAGNLPGAAPGAQILGVKGRVEYQVSGATNWLAAQTNQVLKIKDRLRTHELSEAVIQLADFSVLRIGELSLIEIVPPREYETKSKVSFKQGLLYFFHRNDRRDLDLDTPSVNAAIEGTEFSLEVAPDGATRLALVEGRVVLSNGVDQVRLSSGDIGVAEMNQAPRRVPAVVLANVIQWSLYYPGVLAPSDLQFRPEAESALAASLAAYRQGDLAGAVKAWPADFAPATAEERLFQAGLLLSAGRATNGEAVVLGPDREHPLAVALGLVMAAAKHQALTNPPSPANASQLLGWSYYLQSRNDLKGALTAAWRAAALAPEFGFAWARVTELEFGHGRFRAAETALAKALELSPRHAQAHALRGFAALSRNQYPAASRAFEEAIGLDPLLANGWLGRGLCRIATGQGEAGRADLQAAVAAEPNRWVLRSYLAKAYSAQADAVSDPKQRRRLLAKAREELDLAKLKAPNDPTPWLYSALLAHQQYRTAEAIRDLEKSIELNDNRQVYRSRLLLDQDQSVRSANLAQIYELAGMADVARREAAKAVMADYANYSAHYSLAGSYFTLRDPTRFHLRHETEWLNEHLLASLLAPPGAGTLSQNLSQDEYARLFQQKKFGLSSGTEYYSTGEWRELATHFGAVNGLSYALDLDYQYKNGTRPNHDLSRFEWYSRIKQKITDQDSLLLLTKYQDYDSGDQFQYFDFNTARPNFRFREEQMPWLFAGYHREWAPGVHTLALAGRLVNDQWFSDVAANQAVAILFPVTDPVQVPFDVRLRSHSEIYSGELNQIFQRERHTDILGFRCQRGTLWADSVLDNVVPPGLAPIFGTPVRNRSDGDFGRVSAYVYHHWRLRENLILSGGVVYDWLDYPTNYRRPPIQSGQRRRDQLGPKAALVWSPSAKLTLRGAYARSLGGLSNEGDLRLEPTQLAGFSQSFRTLVSESVLGSVEAPEFDVAGGALDLKFSPGTWLTLDGQWKRSRVDGWFGYFGYNPFTPPAAPAQSLGTFDYRETSGRLLLNQILARDWFFETGYQFTHAVLDQRFLDIPASPTFERHARARADLHELHGALTFNHSSGLFFRPEARWFWQDNSLESGDSNFPLLNVYAGWRFPRHRGEITLGLLNAAGRDYRLHSLNYYPEMPHERTFYARLKFNF